MTLVLDLMDDIWGYAKQNKRDKWWFDLEDLDGVLRIPTVVYE